MAIKTVTVNGETHDINDARITFTSGSTANYLRQDGSWATPPGSGGATTDTKVNQTAVTTSGGYPILLSTASANRATWASESQDGAKEAYVDPAVAINPNQSRIVVRVSTYSTSFGGGSGYDLYDVDNSKFTGTFQAIVQGTASTDGNVALSLGNSTGSGTAGNASGSIYLYGAATVPTLLRSKASGQAKTNYFPNVTGELVVHDNGAAGGSETHPIYITSNGYVQSTAIGSSGKWYNYVPYTSVTGITELGRSIDLHQCGSTTDYDYRFIIDASSTTTYQPGANLVIRRGTGVTGGLQINMPIIGQSGTVSTGNYTTTAASALPAGTTGQIMFVLT